MAYTKDQILAEIRRVSAVVGKTSLKKREFEKYSTISSSAVRYHFESWNNAVAEAGLKPIDPIDMIRNRETIPDDDLLKDLISLYNEYGREPTGALVNAKGKYSEKPYRYRWNSITEAFLIAKKRFPVDVPQPPRTSTLVSVESNNVVPKTIRPKQHKKRRVIFGEPIDFRGLRFAPVNEQGIVYLFGMISHELGYLIESIRTEYPDCEGKRCFDKVENKWEHVSIEFEYKSSNFKMHGHDPSSCDVIVCWEHDWDDCPIEVLELRRTINYL